MHVDVRAARLHDGEPDLDWAHLVKLRQTLAIYMGVSTAGVISRRLIEHGVTFVEVVSNGWDTHQDVFTRTANLAGQIDQPMAMLISTNGMIQTMVE